MTAARRRVVFLPGGVTPVAPSYAPLLEALGDEVDPVLKELEVYASDAPPAGYSIALEVDALRERADAEGLDRLDLVAFSGGGGIALSFAARHPDRLRTLAMFEPANVPGAWDEEEARYFRQLREGMAGLPPDRQVAEFTRLQIREGVEPPAPPPGPPPPWMAKRPAGLDALMRAFEVDDVDRRALARCRFPVYLAYGLLTAEFIVHRVRVLSTLLPDLWIEAYPDTHHFGPPQRTQPLHYASALRELWGRADRTTGARGRGDEGYAA